jgi:hypothetical protein
MAERKRTTKQPKEQPTEIVPETGISADAFFADFDTELRAQKTQESKVAGEIAENDKELGGRFGQVVSGLDTFTSGPGMALSDAEALVGWLDKDLLKKEKLEIPQHVTDNLALLKALQKGYNERKEKIADQPELLEKLHSVFISKEQELAKKIIPELKELIKQLYGEAQTEAEKRARIAFLKSDTAQNVLNNYPELGKPCEVAPETPATTKHEFQKKLISTLIPHHLTTGNHVLNNVEDALRAKEEAEATIKKFETANNTWDTRLGQAKKDKEQIEAYLRKFRTAQFLAERTSARIQSAIKDLPPEDQMRVWENIKIFIIATTFIRYIGVIPEIPEDIHRTIMQELIRVKLLSQTDDEYLGYQRDTELKSNEKWEKLKIFSELLKGSGKIMEDRRTENIFVVNNNEPKEKGGREIIADIDKLAPDFFTEIVALKNFDPQNRKTADLFEVWKTATGAGTNRNETIYRQDRRDSDTAEMSEI